MTTKATRLIYSAFFFCTIGSLVYRCASCMTADPQKVEKQYKAWVPVGTPAADAERIMQKHGFKCHRGEFPSGRPWAGPLLRCRRENHFLNRIWDVDFYLKDERVVGFEDRLYTDFFGLAP